MTDLVIVRMTCDGYDLDTRRCSDYIAGVEHGLADVDEAHASLQKLAESVGWTCTPVGDLCRGCSEAAEENKALASGTNAQLNAIVSGELERLRGIERAAQDFVMETAGQDECGREFIAAHRQRLVQALRSEPLTEGETK